MFKKKKITALILVLTILISLICFEIPVLGAKTFYSEDFENYTGKLDIIEESGNHYATINSSESGKNLIYKDSSSYPKSDFIVSIDFMVPTGGSDRAQLLCVAYKGGNASGMHIWLDGNDIKYGNNGGPGSNDWQKIATNIKRDKWYTIFAYIRNSQFSFEPMPEQKEDCPQGPFFDVYICESTAENPDGIYKIGAEFSDTWRALYNRISAATTSSEKETIIGYSYLGRYIMAREYSNKDLFVDNLSVETVTNEEIDIALYKARSFVGCANVGYSTGDFPQSAVDELMDVYYEVKNTTITDENFEENKIKIETAIETFKSRMIDESDTSENVNHIKINESGNMPSTGGVLADTGFTTLLDAKAYTKSGQVIEDADITWSVLPENDKLTIDGNNLTVAPGFEGKITLTAEAEGVYAKYVMDLVSLRSVAVNKFDGKNGKITLEGELSASIPSEITVSINGDDGDELTEDIFLTDVVLPDENNKFTFEFLVDESVPYQEITATITGGGIATQEAVSYYYGQGWEDGVLEELNAASQNDMAAVLKRHSSVLFVDTALLDSYTDVYVSRIKRNTYTLLKEVDDVIVQTEYVLRQSEVTRSGIEELLKNNSTLHKNNGFDIEKVKDLGESVVPVFYTNAATIEVDTLNDSVKDICDKLNEIYTELADSQTDEDNDGQESASNPSKDKNPGRGGGGGGSAGSFPVGLVGGRPAKEETESPKEDVPQTSNTPFEDVSKDYWAYDAFKLLKEKNIMVGDGVNVRPNDNVTRGEFAKIIVTAFGFEGSKANMFTDGNGAWWNKYASTAAEYGIVNGLGDGRFGGNDVINREMLAVMIARAVKAENIELYDQNEGVTFNDEMYISTYAKEEIAFLSQKGIVSGIGGGLYAPSSYVTRAEAAQIVYNVLKQL